VSALKICPQCGTEYELDQRFCPKDGSTLKLQDATADLVGTIIADRYHVLRKIGEGGMGTVYLAEHVKMGRKSAVKVMNPDMVNNADAISRFNREAANASRISHPNVCAVYDFGETGEGLIYLAMEFIEGPPLTKVIEDQGALPPHRAAEIARQVADALSVAHDMGIVHRDLKPDNIMLARNRDGSDHAKVVDFGIAKAANNEAQRVTKTGLVVGTPEYMSPEQLSGDKLDGRSDIYALGLVTFNMLTGKLPFPAETLQESMIMRLTDRPKPLSEMKGDVQWSPQLQQVLDRALERSAEARYQTSGEFGRELFAAVKGMRDSTATSVIDRASPSQPLPSTRMSEPSLPPTRVSTATPHHGTPVPRSKAKSRAPMFAGLAALVLALGGAGAYYATLGNAANNQPPTTTPGDSNSVATPAGSSLTVSIDAELERIGRLVDVSIGDTASAREGLGRLDRMATSTMSSDQRLIAGLHRAEAYAVLEDKQAACQAVKSVEGASKGTKHEKSVDFLLENSC
jgi:serine/threonine protein kinase